MSTPTHTALPDLPCVRVGHRGSITAITIGTTDDVRGLFAWASGPGTHAATRRLVLEAVYDWLVTREAQLQAREREQADREYGTVALLREAAVLVGRNFCDAAGSMRSRE